MGRPSSHNVRKRSQTLNKLWLFVFLLQLSLQVCQAEEKPPIPTEPKTIKDNDKSKRNLDLIPYPRMGRSMENVHEILINWGTDALHQANANDHFKTWLSNTTPSPDEDEVENDRKDRFQFMPNVPGSEYMLPYPRPGRMTRTVVNGALEEQTRFVRSIDQKFSDKHKQFSSQSSSSPESGGEYYDSITPYPRIGKRFVSLIPHLRFDRKIHETLLPYLRFGRKDDRSNDYQSITPYPRMGKRQDDLLLPYLRFGRRNNPIRMVPQKKSDDVVVPPMRFNENGHGVVDNQFLTPYPRMGRSSDDTLIPYLRFGRQVGKRDFEGLYITPYPRMGKRSSDSVIPHMRFGRQGEFITPYPRLGRGSEDSMIPSMRFGRGTESIYMTPYPRIGKKYSESPNVGDLNEFLTPYPRLGKRSEDTIIPFMRFGKALDSDESQGDDTLIPHLRFGRGEYLTPYPRLGKKSEGSSSILPYLRFGRDDSQYLTPYPRLGKSAEDTLLPYLRFGRGVRSGNNARQGDSKMTDPQPADPIRPARSDLSEEIDEDEVDAKTNETESEEQETLIPYPRFGRVTGEHDHRQQRSALSLLSQLGRSSQEKNSRKHDVAHDSSDDTSYILPYPRPGRTIFLNSQNPNSRDGTENSKGTHSEEDNLIGSNYMLPYLRPGR